MRKNETLPRKAWTRISLHQRRFVDLNVNQEYGKIFLHVFLGPGCLNHPKRFSFVKFLTSGSRIIGLATFSSPDPLVPLSRRGLRTRNRLLWKHMI